MTEPRDELDDELRRLFADERLSIVPKSGAETAVIAGARRRRKQRTVAAAAGGACAIVLLAVGSFAFGGAFSPADQKGDLAAEQTLSIGPSQPVQPPAAPPPPPASPPPASTVLPTVSQPPGPGNPPKPPPTAQPTQKRTAVYVGGLIGRGGYGALRLGMNEKSAAAAGILLNKESSGACIAYAVSGAVPSSAAASAPAEGGITAITPRAPAHTPEGVGTGSTKADVLEVYPSATAAGSQITASSGSGDHFTFTLDGAGKVASISLTSAGAACG